MKMPHLLSGLPTPASQETSVPGDLTLAALSPSSKCPLSAIAAGGAGGSARSLHPAPPGGSGAGGGGGTGRGAPPGKGAERPSCAQRRGGVGGNDPRCCPGGAAAGGQTSCLLPRAKHAPGGRGSRRRGRSGVPATHNHTRRGGPSIHTPAHTHVYTPPPHTHSHASPPRAGAYILVLAVAARLVLEAGPGLGRRRAPRGLARRAVLVGARRPQQAAGLGGGGEGAGRVDLPAEALVQRSHEASAEQGGPTGGTAGSRGAGGRCSRPAPARAPAQSRRGSLMPGWWRWRCWAGGWSPSSPPLANQIGSAAAPGRQRAAAAGCVRGVPAAAGPRGHPPGGSLASPSAIPGKQARAAHSFCCIKTCSSAPPWKAARTVPGPGAPRAGGGRGRGLLGAAEGRGADPDPAPPPPPAGAARGAEGAGEGAGEGGSPSSALGTRLLGCHSNRCFQGGGGRWQSCHPSPLPS